MSARFPRDTQVLHTRRIVKRIKDSLIELSTDMPRYDSDVADHIGVLAEGIGTIILVSAIETLRTDAEINVLCREMGIPRVAGSSC